MNRATVNVLALIACATAVAACQGSPGITRISETSATTTTSSTSKSTVTSSSTTAAAPSPAPNTDPDDPVARMHNMFRAFKNSVIAATKDGTGSYEIPVPPQPTAASSSAHIAAICTGGPDVNLFLDGTPVPPGGMCGNDPGKPGIIVMILAVTADPAAAHTIKVQGAPGQHSWVSMAYGEQ